MSDLYDGREWLTESPTPKKRERRVINKVPCPHCGDPYAVTNVAAHSFGKKCLARAWQRNLEQQGWVPRYRNWKDDFAEAGVQQDHGKISMVPEWARIVYYSCRASNLRNPPLAEWLTAIKSNEAVIAIIIKVRYFAIIHHNPQEVSPIAFIALQGSIETLMNFSREGAPKSGRVNHGTLLKWLNKTLERLRDRTVVFTDEEKHELVIAANKAKLYIDKMDATYPGEMSKTIVDYVETFDRRITALKEMCK